MSKKNTTLQSIRLATIRFQLKALSSQVNAIRELDCEHHDGMDLGVDPELTNILFFAKRLAGRSKEIVSKAEGKDSTAVATLLEQIRGDAAYLAEHAGFFKNHATERADDHLDDMVKSEGQDKKMVEDASSSYLQAGISCFQAESHQFDTFEMQVLAMVNLALEIAFFAADELGLKPSVTPPQKLCR